MPGLARSWTGGSGRTGAIYRRSLWSPQHVCGAQALLLFPCTEGEVDTSGHFRLLKPKALF